MVTHVTHTSHEPSYGRRMAVITACVALVVALSLGAAGGFVAWVVNGAGTGAWIASFFCLHATRREGRRPSSPWSEAPPVPVDRYLWTGGLIGGVAGLALAVADAWPLA